ncbi:MAG: hypothetical protein WCX28_08940 [Bacteriovoracaceae bacterium]|nr:hypothetical protein [Bacteroidota bacterium]
MRFNSANSNVVICDIIPLPIDAKKYPIISPNADGSIGRATGSITLTSF